MKNRSTLSKKLASYSALATVVLAGSKASDAQILYTDVNPDDTVYVVDNYLLDLNNDGTLDFRFNLMHESTVSGTNPYANQIRVVGYGTNSILRDPSPPYSSYPYAKALAGGALIGGSATFSYQAILATNESSGYYLWGNWPGVTNAFIGLRIELNLNTYYGWARLSVDSASGQLIVSDYAMDTVANQTIIAGDKCGNYAAYANTVINPSGSVPVCEGSNVTLTTDSFAGFTYQWLVNNSLIPGANTFNYAADSSGNYSVIVTNSYGCVDTAEGTQVTVFPLPAMPAISQTEDTLISTAAVSYQWYLNNVPIPGATDQTYAASIAGSYTVQITDANGCTSVSDSYAFIPQGIENSEVGSIHVFEANNIVFIRLNDAEFLGGEIKIFNALGSNVYSSIVNDEMLQIDLNHMTAGIYLLTIDKRGKSVAQKIVIQ